MNRVKIVEQVLDYNADADLTPAADLGGYEHRGLFIPTINTGNLAFHVCDTLGGTYSPVKGADGAAEVIVSGAGGFAVSGDALDFLIPYRFVKIETIADQNADRTFVWSLKEGSR